LVTTGLSENVISGSLNVQDVCETKSFNATGHVFR
jgi:hypothetical protein